MKRIVLVVLAAMLVVSSAATVLAQGADYLGAPSSGLLGSMSRLAGLGSLGTLGQGAARVSLWAGVGFQHLGVNFSFPAFSQASGGPIPINLKFQNANLWIGQVGMDAQLSSTCALFLIAEGNLKKDIDVTTAEEGFGVARGWRGTGLQWWAIDGGLAYEVSPGLALLAGLRRDNLSVNLNNPKDAFGIVVNVEGHQNLSADFQALLWVPYIGLQAKGPNYRGTFIWSPYAQAEIKVPESLSYSGEIVVPVLEKEVESIRYSVTKPGVLLEGSFEYDWSINSSLLFQLWARGSWLRVSGKGTAAFTVSEFSTPPPTFEFASDSSGGTASYSRYLLSGGISAVLPF